MLSVVEVCHGGVWWGWGGEEYAGGAWGGEHTWVV